MRATSLIGIVSGVILLCAPMAYAADAARGAVVARVRCMPCHFLNRTERKLGPGLLGVYGRVPTITGVPFAHWDAHSLDMWLAGPRQVKKNTTMFFPPLEKRDRADVIAWLREKESLRVQSARKDDGNE
ncbi:MAG: c-type cytochrome [Mariprofundaceae bacterium]|nr:c-type cytochrome [Mariprofundaceae bacterium]